MPRRLEPLNDGPLTPMYPTAHFSYDAIFSEVHDTTVTCLTDVELTAVPQDELRLVVSKDRYFSTTVKVASPSYSHHGPARRHYVWSQLAMLVLRCHCRDLVFQQIAPCLPFDGVLLPPLDDSHEASPPLRVRHVTGSSTCPRRSTAGSD
eukprot:scaffold88449_cov30-Tisochrysis_lutea.AAC.6